MNIFLARHYNMHQTEDSQREMPEKIRQHFSIFQQFKLFTCQQLPVLLPTDVQDLFTDKDGGFKALRTQSHKINV